MTAATSFSYPHAKSAPTYAALQPKTQESIYTYCNLIFPGFECFHEEYQNAVLESLGCLVRNYFLNIKDAKVEQFCKNLFLLNDFLLRELARLWSLNEINSTWKK